jgi:hypothetical protein
MSRSLLVIVLAGAAALLVVGPVLAQVEVGNLAVSASESRDDATTFVPVGTTSVYVLFDYENAANHRIGVTIEGFGIDNILTVSDRYNGTGQGVVEITGTQIYQSLTESMVRQAEAVQGNVKKAVDQELGRIDYLQSVQAATYKMGATIALIEKLDLNGAQSGFIDDLRRTVESLDELVTDALEGGLDDAERKARAEALKAPADDVYAAALALSTDAESASDLAIPPTGSKSGYTVQVTVSSAPADSTEFYVLESNDSSQGGARTDDPNQPTADPSELKTRSAPSGQSRGTSGYGDESGAGTKSQQDAKATDAARDSSGAGGASSGAVPTSASRASGSSPTRSSSGAAPTPEAGAAFGAQQQAQQGTASGSEGVSVTAGESAAEVSQTGAEGGLAASAEGSSMPTWTPPAVAKAPVGEDVPQPVSAAPEAVAETGGGGSSGPNLAVLGLGAIALIGVAFWLRQRS